MNYENRLKQLFYDPKTMGSADKLYKILKSEGHIMTLKDVKTWMANQESQQILQVDKTPIIYPPITSDVITSDVITYQADLTFYDQFARQNGGFHIIMCFIEITSRKAFCYALKNKNEKSINEKYEQFLKDINYDIKALTTDSGTEFTSKSFAAINEKQNIKHYFAEVGDKNKMSKVERFNKTIRGKITQYLKST